nr:hypothetical protein [candidate division Zixibacteria bacterium]
MRYPAIILLIILAAVPVYGYDFEAGRISGMAGSIMLSNPSATDLISCPVILPEAGRIVFETGYQRKFELSDLDRVYAAAGYRYRGLSTSLGFSQFGRSGYYTEQLIKSSLVFNYRWFSLGVGGGVKLVEIGEVERKYSLSAVGIDLAAGFKYKVFHAAAIAENINRPRLDENAPADQPVYSIYGEIEGSADFSVVGKVAFEKYEKPRLSIGQYIRIMNDNALFWGVSNNPLTYGGGVEIKYSMFGLMYAVSYHPVLGFTHNISLNFLSGEILK